MTVSSQGKWTRNGSDGVEEESSVPVSREDEEIGLTRKKSNSREIRLLGEGDTAVPEISGLSVRFVFNLSSRLLKFLLATRLFLFVPWKFRIFFLLSTCKRNSR